MAILSSSILAADFAVLGEEIKETDAKVRELEEKIHDLEPILYALLNSNFLSVTVSFVKKTI